jgi:hypothetical protein
MITMTMGWDYVSELRPPAGLLFIPRWYVSGEITMSAEEHAWLAWQTSLAIAPADSSGSKQEKLAKGMRIWPCEVFFAHTFKWFFICCKILRHGSFISHPKKGVLLNVIALKNPSLLSGLNPRTLGLVASTLTITRPRRLLGLLISCY